MDITENLRDMASPMAPSYAHVLERAADEIDRLRAENAETYANFTAYRSMYHEVEEKRQILLRRIAELEALLTRAYGYTTAAPELLSEEIKAALSGREG